MKLKLNADEWELGERIDGGGFGEVYAAASSSNPSAVAKLVPKAPGADRELLFVNPKGVRNVVPVIDSGETDQHWVLVMPRADKSLRQHLDEAGGPLDAQDAAEILRDIATALADLKGKIVHRDIKPQNALLLDGNWCLADFGISRYAEATTAPDTRKFAMTYPYAAPEQWRAERASTATDVYSLGILAFEMLTDSLPFTGPAMEDFREQHLHNDPPSLTNVAPELAGLVLECMQKAAGARPSPANILARLEKIGTGRQSPGIARLRDANLAEVQRRGESARRESEQRSEAERRKELFESAESLLEKISNALVQAIAEAAPSASISGGPTAPIIQLNQAKLEIGNAGLTPEKPWSGPHSPAFDVISHSLLSLIIPAGSDEYEGRSHSLWYCDAQDAGHYQWFETAFMFSPLIPARGRQNPFALPPEKEAAVALGNVVAEYDVAWPFTPLSTTNLDEFIDRWAGWFADAAEGRLRHPSTMPESPPQGSWRRR